MAATIGMKKYFKSRYDAKKQSKLITGYKVRIIFNCPGYIIECNGNKYLLASGEIG